MSEITREEAIQELTQVRLLFFWMKNRAEACSLAIEALRGEPAAAQRDRFMKEVAGLRNLKSCMDTGLEAARTLIGELTESLNTTKEALRAEGRGHYWHNRFIEMEARYVETKRKLTDAHNITALGKCLGCEELRAELQAERERVGKLKRFLRNSKWGCKETCMKEVLSLFPDPAPEPAPQMWAWALEELKAGRRVQWKTWDNGQRIWALGSQIRYRTIDGFGILYTPSIPHFTEPGWLPYEKEK